MKTLPYFVWLAMVLLAIGCKPLPKQMVVLHIGSTSLMVEIVHSPAKREQGLMGRTSLPPGQGMLFIFDKPQPLAFWMKNTSIPLDIGYFTADGTLQEIYALYPYDLNAVRSHRQDLIYALEVPQGWFAQSKVIIGQKLEKNWIIN